MCEVGEKKRRREAARQQEEEGISAACAAECRRLRAEALQHKKSGVLTDSRHLPWHPVCDMQL